MLFAVFIILAIISVGIINIEHRRTCRQHRMELLHSQLDTFQLEDGNNFLQKKTIHTNGLSARIPFINTGLKFDILFFFGLTTIVVAFFVFFSQLQHHLREHKQHSDTLLKSNSELNKKTQEQAIELESHQLLLKFTEKVPTVLFQMEMDAAGKMSFPFLSKGIERLIPQKETINEIKENGSLGFSMVYQEDVSYLMDSLQNSYQNLTDWTIEYRNLWENGEIRWMKGYAKPESKENGVVTWYGYLEDITESKKQEQTLKQLNRELVESNEELEKFAYIASHDLQEPLRMISSFLDLLGEDCGDEMSETGKQYLGFATQGTVRMKRIIDDLLEYSKVGKQTYGLENIDLDELLGEVILLNNVLIKEKNALVEWEEMPTIRGVKTHIQQVFHNLIGNALKYQKPNNQPTIKICAKELNNYWQFSVEDNGIGIEEKHFEKVFAVFQRLHTRKEYEGTGIGLSICKKIVEKHNGEMWIESIKGEGSTFHFTIEKGKR